MFRTFGNSNFDIVSDFVLRDSGFDSSIHTMNYGVTSSNYFWDMTLGGEYISPINALVVEGGPIRESKVSGANESHMNQIGKGFWILTVLKVVKGQGFLNRPRADSAQKRLRQGETGLANSLFR